MAFVFHITTSTQALAAIDLHVYTPVEFDADGFIHCSYLHQVENVANRFYARQTNLVLLKIDQSTLKSPLVDENLEGGSELFPHIYGPLMWSSVVEVIPFLPSADGRFHFR